MALPTFPQSTADYVAALTDDDFINGGHRTNFLPTAKGGRSFADYCRLLAIELVALAEAVEEDAASAAAGSGTESSVSNIRAGTSAQYLSIRRVYEANVPVALTYGGTVSWNMAAGVNFKLTLTGNCTLANPTNAVSGKSGLLRVIQDGTGGRSITSFGNQFIMVGGAPVWPTAPNARSVFSYFVDEDGKIELTFGGSSA